MAGAVQLVSSLTFQPPVKSEHAQPGHDIPPDMQVLVAADTRTFHVAGCSFIHNRDKLRTMTAKEAIQAGYVPCVRCLRKYLNVAASYSSEDGESADEQAAEEQDLRRAEH